MEMMLQLIGFITATGIPLVLYLHWMRTKLAPYKREVPPERKGPLEAPVILILGTQPFIAEMQAILSSVELGVNAQSSSFLHFDDYFLHIGKIPDCMIIGVDSTLSNFSEEQFISEFPTFCCDPMFNDTIFLILFSKSFKALDRIARSDPTSPYSNQSSLARWIYGPGMRSDLVGAVEDAHGQYLIGPPSQHRNELINAFKKFKQTGKLIINRRFP